MIRGSNPGREKVIFSKLSRVTLRPT